jgi:hypothetical protein
MQLVGYLLLVWESFRRVVLGMFVSVWEGAVSNHLHYPVLRDLFEVWNSGILRPQRGRHQHGPDPPDGTGSESPKCSIVERLQVPGLVLLNDGRALVVPRKQSSMRIRLWSAADRCHWLSWCNTSPKGLKDSPSNFASCTAWIG